MIALVLARGAVPLRGIAVIPIAGILVGGAMTATSLAGRRLRDELSARRGEVEAALALGLFPRDAVLLVDRPVTLPGAFAGVLLGGGSPLEAGAAQLLVLVGLLAAQVLAVCGVTDLMARGAILDDVPR